MIKGLDANTPLTNHAECIKRAGFSFCCRYLKETESRLTHTEAKSLSAAGLYIVSIVERGFPTSSSYFSHTKGMEDGAWSYTYMKDELKQPIGSCCYFAVDYDASLSDIKGPIKDYFNGILKSFSAGGHPEYAIGVYGSGATCRWLLKNTHVTYAWLSMSMGWLGSRSFKGWNIKQSISSGPVCSLSVDLDISN